MAFCWQSGECIGRQEPGGTRRTGNGSWQTGEGRVLKAAAGPTCCASPRRMGLVFGHADRPALPVVMAISRKVDKDGVHQGEHALMGGCDSSRMAAVRFSAAGSAGKEMQPHPGPGHENSEPAGPRAHRPLQELAQPGEWGPGPG